MKKLSIKEIGLPKIALILVIGIFLILSSFPSVFSQKKEKNNETAFKDKKNDKQEDEEKPLDDYTKQLEDRLKNILMKVDGIGEVDVMITLKSSKEKIVLKDAPYTQESLNEIDGEGGTRTNKSITNNENTILITNEKGEANPYIIREVEPEIEGVLVIARGGNDGKIATDVVEAVSVLFNIPAYKVKVMEIKKGVS